MFSDHTGKSLRTHNSNSCVPPIITCKQQKTHSNSQLRNDDKFVNPRVLRGNDDDDNLHANGQNADD